MAAAWLWVRPFPALLLTGLLLLASFRLWLVLWRLVAEGEAVGAAQLVEIFWAGARLDLASLCLLCILLALSLLLVRRPQQSRWVLGYGAFVLLFLSLFEVGGFFFFSYYDFRPNYLVLEYAGNPEVAGMLMADYPILEMVLGGVAIAAVAMALFARLAGFSLRGTSDAPGLRWFARAPLVLVLLALCVLGNRGTFGSRRINPSLAAVSADRAVNEIAGTGIYNIAYEIDQRLNDRYGNLANHLDLLPPAAALRATLEHLPGGSSPGAHNPILRRIENPPRGGPRNVVLVLMEAFTGRLVGGMGGVPALSPHIDRLAHQGVFFSNCYATGERTIQGLEAVVSSFPPLPGVSVIRRPEARSGFASLAAVLKKRNYSTHFFYGGNASFDQMRGFFRGSGFDRIIEEKDFDAPIFRGKWGVSDEDIFRRADEELIRAHANGEAFFAVILTVSLHAPWEYPDGRIETLPEDTEVPPGFRLAELNNFLYADWAIGDFVERASQSPYADDTLFVFVADHGVHLRGRQVLPSEEYRVPLLFYSPRWLAPRRVERVVSQLDIAPTIMGILGGSYESPFFGSDALKDPEAPGLAPMIYRKAIHGVRAGSRLSVLGRDGTRSYDVSSRHEVSEAPLSVDHEADARRTLALLQVAEELLRTRSFTPD